MKIGIKILIFVLCLNSSIAIVNDSGIAPTPSLAVTPYNMTKTLNDFNSTNFSGEPTTQSFFDIGRGIQLLKIVMTIIAGFPFLMHDLGVPDVITLPISVIVYIMIAFTFIEMWSGSTQTDEY